MTTEEKAKAYDEALKKAKEMYDTYRFSVDPSNFKPTDFEYIFPQLKESEDERIRKGLIDIFNTALGQDFLQRKAGLNRDEVIAYLEKQKIKEKQDRMMPVYNDRDSFESALEKAWKSYNECGSRTVDSFEDDYIECAHAKGFREGYLFGIEKQKEQKQEWSESDKQNINLIISYLDSYIEEHNDTFGADECKYLQYWLKSLPLNLKKKNEDVAKLCSNEWSEEDEKMINTLVSYVEDPSCWKLKCPREKLVDFIKSLPKRFSLQTKQEWNDGKNILEDIIVFVSGYADKRVVTKWVSFLKSLKSHWKPSEEQMNGLAHAINLDVYDAKRYGLDSLYNDLKKLM